MLRHLLYRPVFLTATVVLLLMLLTLSLFAGKSWRSLERLRPLQSHIAEISRLQDIQNFQIATLTNLDRKDIVDDAMKDKLRREVIGVIAFSSYLVPQTTERLRAAHEDLNQLTENPRGVLIDSLSEFRGIIGDEIAAHDLLLSELRENNQWELAITLMLVVAVPLLISVSILRLRKRILLPLQNLGVLMGLLSQSEFRAVSTRNIDTLLLPLFENYNGMVRRLEELEQANRARHDNLEAEVRSTTRLLLEQHRELANSARLVAVGELAAYVAHDLRNPLAGIQMALENISHELKDPEQGSTLENVLKELRRMTRLLNDILSQAAQTPEPFVRVCIADAVSTVLSVLRYQVPDDVQMRQEIPTGLYFNLPEGRFRQVLLNLVLNATQSVDGRGGTVTVRAAPVDNSLKLTVSDDGPGFPEGLLNQGVRPFATWREKGTGLGLVMVQRFIRELDGDMELANLKSGGAAVIIRLPGAVLYG